MGRHTRTALVFSALIVLAGTSLNAHPHMFFSSEVEFVWSGERLSGAYLDWTFDSFFSADLIHGYDRNRDGKFDATETREIFDNAFANLRHYYYFTFIRQQSKRSNPAAVKEFSARQRNGTVSYRFYIDLSGYAPGELFLAVYDYTFFCDIRPGEQPVRLRYEPALVRPRFEVVENKDYPVYYDPLAPADDTTVHYSYRPGLKTYYPKEIRIHYDN